MFLVRTELGLATAELVVVAVVSLEDKIVLDLHRLCVIEVMFVLSKSVNGNVGKTRREERKE